MKRLFIIIGIALAVWGLYIVVSQKEQHDTVPIKATVPPATENSNVVETEKPKATPQIKEEAKPVAATEDTAKIDPQKKRELLQKQSVFKNEGK